MRMRSACSFGPLFSFFVMGVMTGFMTRLPGARLLARLFVFCGLSVAGIRASIHLGIDLIYPALFMLKSQYEVLLALLFWNLANDLFNTRQSKRIFPLVTAGGVIGQILGSFITPLVVRSEPWIHQGPHQGCFPDFPAPVRRIAPRVFPGFFRWALAARFPLRRLICFIALTPFELSLTVAVASPRCPHNMFRPAGRCRLHLYYQTCSSLQYSEIGILSTNRMYAAAYGQQASCGNRSYTVQSWFECTRLGLSFIFRFQTGSHSMPPQYMLQLTKGCCRIATR